MVLKARILWTTRGEARNYRESKRDSKGVGAGDRQPCAQRGSSCAQDRRMPVKLWAAESQEPLSQALHGLIGWAFAHG
jgi:hypothetical protein